MGNDEINNIESKLKSLEDTVDDLIKRTEQLEQSNKEFYDFINDVRSNYKREKLDDQYNIYDRDFI